MLFGVLLQAVGGVHCGLKGSVHAHLFVCVCVYVYVLTALLRGSMEFFNRGEGWQAGFHPEGWEGGGLLRTAHHFESTCPLKFFHLQSEVCAQTCER